MNKDKSKIYVSLSDTISIGITLGLFYWFLDAAVDVYMLGDESFLSSVFSPRVEQIWMRIFILCLMITFSFVARFINNKRKSTENALIKSEDRFRSLLITSSDGIIIHNGERIIEANQKLTDILGYELQEIVGKAPKDFLDEESQKRMTENIQDKDSTLIQVTAVKKNGNKVTLEFVSRMISYYGETVWITTVSDCSVPSTESEESQKDSNHYRQLLQNSNDPLFVYGLTNENSPDLFIESSEMACRKFGYSPEEYEKLNIMEIIVPEERDNILAVFQTLIDFKHSIFETEILTKEKERVPVEISSHLFNLDNRPMIISTLREITERKKANKLLRDSEKQYHRLFDNTPVAYLSLEPNGNVIEVNNKWCISFGYSKEETVDSWFGDFLTRSNLDHFRAVFGDLDESKEQVEIDLEIVNKDKTISNMLLIARSTQSSFGDIQTVQCILLDNSRQKESIETKQKQKQWLEQIIDNTSDIIFSFKPDGTITNVNPAFEKVMGNSTDSFIDCKLDMFIHPDDLDFVHQAINKCIEGEIIPAIEIRLQTISEEYVPAELTFSAYFQENSVAGIDCIAKNISKHWAPEMSSAEPDKTYKIPIESLPDPACIIDRDLKILGTNKAHEKLSEKLGLPTSLEGQSFIDIYPFETEQSREDYQKIFENEKTEITENNVIAEAGDYTFEIKRIPIFEDDTVSQIIHVFRDITKQKWERNIISCQRDLAITLGEATAFEDILRLCTEHAIKMSNMDSGGVYLLDYPVSGLNLVYHQGLSDDFISVSSHYSIDSDSARLVMAGKPIYSKHQDMNLILDNLSQQEGLRATGIIPIQNDGWVIGCLNIASHTRDEMPPETRHAVEIIAGQIGEAIARAKAEETMLESEKRFRQMAENIDEVLWMTSLDNSQLIYISPSYEKIWGRSCESLNKNPEVWIETIHEEDREQVKTVRGKRLDGNCDIEYRIVRPDKSIRWIRDRAFPIRDDNGEIYRIVGIAEDITNHKLAVEKLQLLSSAIEQSTEGMAVVDLDGNIQYINNAFANMHGYDPEELANKPLSIFHTPEQMPAVDKANRQIKETGKFAGELWHVHRNGTVFPTIMNNSLIKDDKDNPVAMIGTVRDITKRKQTERALQQISSRNKAILEAVPDIIIEVDENKVYTWANKAGYEFFGEDVIGKEASFYFKGEQDTYETVSPVFKGDDNTLYVESWQRRKDGEKRLLAWWCQVLKDEDGNATGALSTARDITEIKTAEEKLRESEEKFRAVFETAEDSIFIKNCDLKYIQVNPAMEKLFDLPALELIGKTDNDIFGQEAGKHIREIDMRVLGGEIIEDEHAKPIDGKLHTFHAIKVPMRNTEGEITGLCGIARDITERKLAEEALRESEERVTVILDSIQFGIAIIDAETHKIVDVNSIAAKMIDAPKEQIVGNLCHKYICPAEEGQCPITDLGRSVDNSECILLKANSEIIPILKTVVPIMLNGHQHLIEGFIDITDRKQAEEALRKSEEKFHSIVELSVDGITLIDKECKIAEWNQGQEIITGLKKDDVLDKSIYDVQYQLVSEERKSDQLYQMMKSSMLAIVKDGLSPYLNEFTETEIVRPDGEHRTVEILSFPIKTEDGYQICSITRDITDKKLLEDELSKAEKLESIGVLAGGIAHDFNNILTAILGNISLAKMDTVSESDINTRLIQAEKASERAQDLTRQLLTFAKGGTPIKKTISIRNLIKESVEFALHGSNVKSLFNISDDLSAVDADAGQISQVINNLIINANQAMPNGGTITISAINVDVSHSNQLPLKDGQYVRIVISDEGTGIPEDYLKRIFDPYFTTKQKGSGLGLATTYSIIKNHDGYIDVESKQGEGTSFTIHLPISEKPEEIEIEEDDIKAAGGGKILVMDDEDAIRMVTGVALTKAGYKVEFAVNGEEAVDKYKSSFEEGSPFDLIFMDLTIPGGMGGQEALEKIKEIDPNARAIVSSGYSNNPTMADHEKFGFCGVITKPYKAENLNRIVYQVLHSDKIPV